MSFKFWLPVVAHHWLRKNSTDCTRPGGFLQVLPKVGANVAIAGVVQVAAEILGDAIRLNLQSRSSHEAIYGN